jgi:hypothetical protein
MASKMVLDRERSALQVAQAAETHAQAVAEKLKAVLGEGAPDAAAIRALGAVVRRDAAALVAADAAHEAELADDVAPRAARDAAVEAVYRLLGEVRASTAVAFGEAVATELGFAGTTPREPVALAALATTVGGRLPKLRDRAPVVPGLRFDPAPYEAALPPAVAALRASLDDVRREAREAETTYTAKQRALATYDERFGAAASALTGLFHLAGEHELAARVRPSVRRPGRTQADADGEEPVAPVVN